MKLDVKTVEDLAKNLNEYGLESLELELGTEKLVLKKRGELLEEKRVAQQPLVLQTPKKVEKEETVEENKNKLITSPMTGTIYRAPAPGKQAFVKEGDVVKEGDTLCIVEAMKMMNEVKSTEAGTIVKILVEDGVVVKKEEVLFEIK